MARQEIRASVQVLIAEKNVIEKEVIALRDRLSSKAEELGKLRTAQMSHREAMQSLPNAEAHKAAKIVLNRTITDLQVNIDTIQKEHEALTHDFEKANGKLKNIQQSIRELEVA